MIDSNLLEASELCDKLLTKSYFEKSEAYLNSIIKRKAFGEFNRLKWVYMYYNDRRKKSKDLRALFKLIEKYSEDWC